MQVRLAADIQTDSIVDGPGLRAVIWTQGCAHNCEGCHNPQTHDFNSGALVDTEEVKEVIGELKYHDGVTFSGGDPMYQAASCNDIASYCKSIGLDVWVYTGFTYEEILKMAKKDKSYMDFLNNIDVLVDGPFILEKRSLELLFRGSSNQRLINVPLSLASNKVVLVDESIYKSENEYEMNTLFV